MPAIGFAGDVLLLLELVQHQQIDLRALDLLALIDQLVAAVSAEAAGPLSQRADWAVTGAELLRLRSAMMLPVHDRRHQEAQDAAARLQRILQARAEGLALAGWLDERAERLPPTWRRGCAEPVLQAGRGDDLLQFLWGCVGVFAGFGLQGEDGLTERYVVTPLPFWRFEDALARIRDQLARPPHEATLVALAPPDATGGGGRSPQAVYRRAAWASTFMASLELAREGVVVLESCAPEHGGVLVRAEAACAV